MQRSTPSGRAALAAVALLGLVAGGCARPASGSTPPGDGAPPASAAASPPPPPRGPAPPPPSDRLFVIAGVADVRDAPSAEARRIGTIRAGGSVRTTGDAGTAGCPGGWSAIEPTGFVCQGAATTRDAASPAARILSEYRLASDSALPATYGFADETPVYLRVPTYDEQVLSEPTLPARTKKRATLRRVLASAQGVEFPSDLPDVDFDPAADEVPDDLRGGAFAPLSPKPVTVKSPVSGALVAGTPVAWIAELEAAGRTWLLTPELMFLPRDRVRRAVVSTFRGLEPTGEGRLAFVRGKPCPKYRMARYGYFEPQVDTWPSGATIALEHDVRKIGAAEYLETTEAATYVLARDVSLARPSSGSAFGLDDGARWIEVDASAGTLMLHDGPKVAYATLVSVGIAGTPRGKFRVVGKHLTLASPFEASRWAGASAEVPEVLLAAEGQDAKIALALHAAWWLPSFGDPKGTPGVALSPLDARRLFDWTDPKLPPGWHSASGEGTWVVVHD